jgi:hypothetical protein
LNVVDCRIELGRTVPGDPPARCHDGRSPEVKSGIDIPFGRLQLYKMVLRKVEFYT